MPSVAIVRPGATPASGPASTCRFLRRRRSRASVGVCPQRSRKVLDRWLGEENPLRRAISAMGRSVSASSSSVVKVLYQSTDIPHLQSIERALADVTGDIDVSYSSGRYLEFNARGVNKGAGLLRLARELGVDPADTIAVGDNWNDWPMIRDAGLGACVANAVADMKPRCDYVCEATCDESAVAEVIERFVLGRG